MNDLHVGRPLWLVTQKVVLTNATSRRNNFEKIDIFAEKSDSQNCRRMTKKIRGMTKKNQKNNKNNQANDKKIRKIAKGKKIRIIPQD